MKYFLRAFEKYAVFSGRATLAEYWYFTLVHFIIVILLSVLESSGTITAIYSLIAFIPNIAIAVRRVHDVNKSGWFIFVPIYNIVLLLTNGSKGDNKYGKISSNS